MLLTIVKKCSSLDDEPGAKEDVVDIQKMIKEETSEADAKKKRLMGIKGKIQSVAKISKMYTVLREDSELILKIKNISPDGKLPRGLLLDGKPAIRHAAKQFNIAQQLDKENEKRPKKK